MARSKKTASLRVEREPLPIRKRIVGEFLNHVRERDREIVRRLAKGEELARIIEEGFCGGSGGSYRKGDPLVTRFMELHARQMEDLRPKLLRAGEALGLRIVTTKSDLAVQTRGGAKSPAGRLFYNVRPEKTVPFFHALVQGALERGMHAEIRTFREASAEAFNRPHKIEFIFSEAEEKDALALAERLRRDNANDFEQGSARFMADILPGVSFGEHPRRKDETFESLRAKILADIYVGAKAAGLHVAHPAFDADAAFRQACLVREVDAENPAFNISKGESFPLVRRFFS